MDRNSKVTWLVVAVILIGCGWLVVRSGQANAVPITLGFIGPLTGDVSSIGTLDKAAVEMAVEEVNAGGGINGRPLEVVYEDGQCDSTKSVNAAQKLIEEDHVLAIIGGLCSTETSAFGPTAMSSKVLVFSYGSSAPELSQLGKYFFRDYPSDNFQGRFAAEYAYNTLGARKAAIIYHVSSWGAGIKEVFEKRFTELGGTVVAAEGTPQESRDYRTILSKVDALSPDLIYAPLYSEGSIVMMDQAVALGITTNMLGSETWDDPKVQKAASLKGPMLYTVQRDAKSEDFQAKLIAKTGTDNVPATVANAYDAVHMLALALGKSGTSNPDKIQAELRKMQYNGASGPIAFDENGDLTTASYVVKKIENGTSVEVK